jgi:Sulfotransferase family
MGSTTDWSARSPHASAERAVVFGAPRSGTTFLMGVLDALPELECVSGNLLPVGIAHLAAQDLPEPVREGLERSFRGGLTDYLTTGAYHSRAAALRKWWALGRPMSGLWRAAHGVRKESMLVYKEPFLAFAPELPYRALAHARLIYIFRDGRDVADSLVRSYRVLSDDSLSDLESNEVQLGRRVGDRYVPWWVTEDETPEFLKATPYVRAVWMWREMVRRCERLLMREEVKRSGRVLRIRYEELMAEPLEQGRRVTAHLGLDPPRMASKRLREAHECSIGIHRRRESTEILAAERLAGHELTTLGYALHGSNGDPPGVATSEAHAAVAREPR